MKNLLRLFILIIFINCCSFNPNSSLWTKKKEIKKDNILNPIINSESIWKSHALYLIAEYFYSKNEKEKSKEFFKKIVGMNNSNQNIKVESQKRLNRDF